jgi:putative lipoic acid-binding regulatory protein
MLLARAQCIHTYVTRRIARPASQRARVAFASSSVADSSGDDPERATPLDASLLDTMRELRKTRDARSTPNEARTPTVMASNEDDENDAKWKALDARVNEYPCARKFQAIGLDDGTFVDSVREMISEALGGRYIHPENVTARPSSKGKYVSANVVLEMESGDDVLAVYGVLKADKRVLWYL